jgi:hypothetical protein
MIRGLFFITEVQLLAWTEIPNNPGMLGQQASLKMIVSIYSLKCKSEFYFFANLNSHFLSELLGWQIGTTLLMCSQEGFKVRPAKNLQLCDKRPLYPNL